MVLPSRASPHLGLRSLFAADPCRHYRRWQTIKAVRLPSKESFLYVFDRVTGKPIWPIVERPVPQGDVPGEQYSPTQPFPTKPPAYARQAITMDDLIDFTPELHAKALELVKHYKMGPMFTARGGQQGWRARSPRSRSATWAAARTGPARATIRRPTRSSRRQRTRACRRWDWSSRRRGIRIFVTSPEWPARSSGLMKALAIGSASDAPKVSAAQANWTPSWLRQARHAQSTARDRHDRGWSATRETALRCLSRNQFG